MTLRSLNELAQYDPVSGFRGLTVLHTLESGLHEAMDNSVILKIGNFIQKKVHAGPWATWLMGAIDTGE